MSLFWANAFAQIDFEDAYIEVNDIVFADSSGHISYEIPYLYGNELIKRVRAVTASGYEVLIVIPPGGNGQFVYTPGLDVELSIISPTLMRIRDLNTGETKDVTRPSGGWPEISTLALPGPTDPWQHEMKDLIDAYMAKHATGEIFLAQPMNKYEVLGYNTQGLFPDSCSATACTFKTVLAVGHILGTAVGCAGAGTGILTGPGLAVCSIGWAAIPFTAGDAIDSCTCTPAEKPPIAAEPIEPEPGLVCDPVCTNFQIGIPPLGWTCQKWVKTIVTIPGYGSFEDKVCVRYGPDP